VRAASEIKASSCQLTSAACERAAKVLSRVNKKFRFRRNKRARKFQEQQQQQKLKTNWIERQQQQL
jgi:hypothetical protein